MGFFGFGKKKKKPTKGQVTKKNIKRKRTPKGGKKGITTATLKRWKAHEAKMAKDFDEHGLKALAKHDKMHVKWFDDELKRRKKNGKK